jgi:hypothetical protein
MACKNFESGDDVKTRRRLAGNVFKPADHGGANPGHSTVRIGSIAAANEWAGSRRRTDA